MVNILVSAVLLLLLPTMTFSTERKPAVEDFVGIEVNSPETDSTRGLTPEPLFNFEQDGGVGHYGFPRKSLLPETNSTRFLDKSHLASYGVFGLVLALPILIWFLVMSHLKRKALQAGASNIEILEKYRRPSSKKGEENSDRKAS